MKFQDIRIYNKDFELLMILPKYVSANWEIKFNEFGFGEIELEKTKELVTLLLENKYLFLFQGEIQSVITGYNVAKTIKIFTRTFEWLLTKYVTGKFNASEIQTAITTGALTKSQLIEHILSENLHPDFNLEFIGLENDETDVTDYISDEPKDIYTAVREIINSETTGFKFYRDIKRGKTIFMLLEAKENKEFILCDEYKTAYESSYSYDIQEEATGGIFYHKITNMGDYDAENNWPPLQKGPHNYGKYYRATSEGNVFGEIKVTPGDVILCKNMNGSFERILKVEPFLVRIEPEEKGIFSWSSVLNANITENAQKELKEKKKTDTLFCKTMLSYLEDFNLGDIVETVFLAEGLPLRKQKLIKEIHLWDEPDDTGAMPTMTDISNSE